MLLFHPIPQSFPYSTLHRVWGALSLLVLGRSAAAKSLWLVFGFGTGKSSDLLNV